MFKNVKRKRSTRLFQIFLELHTCLLVPNVTRSLINVTAPLFPRGFREKTKANAVFRRGSGSNVCFQLRK